MRANLPLLGCVFFFLLLCPFFIYFSVLESVTLKDFKVKMNIHRKWKKKKIKRKKEKEEEVEKHTEWKEMKKERENIKSKKNSDIIKNNLKGNKNSLELHEPSMKYIVATSMYIHSVSYVYIHSLAEPHRFFVCNVPCTHIGQTSLYCSSFSTRTKKRTLLLIRCSVFRFNTRCCRWDYCRDFFSSLLVCFSTAVLWSLFV